MKKLSKIFMLASMGIMSINVAFAAQTTPGVTLYEHGKFNGTIPGASLFVPAGTEIPKLKDTVIGNDELSSMEVFPGCTVSLYANNNFNANVAGNNLVVVDDIEKLKDTSIGNDTVSSMKVSCEPGVILFEHGKFNETIPGASLFIPAGTEIPKLKDTVIGNDELSSMAVFPGCTATLYEHGLFNANNAGEDLVVTDHIEKFKDTSIGNDSVSSMKVSCAPINQGPGVTLYEHGAFNGNISGASLFVPAGTDIPKLKDTVIGNDELSSMEVSPGCTVSLYEHGLFNANDATGRSEQFTGDVYKFAGTYIENDAVSSLKVSCTAPLEVILYNELGLSGYSLGFPTGDYADFGDVGSIGNNLPSSVHIPTGCTATIYKDQNFSEGDLFITLTEGDYDFPQTNSSGSLPDDSASSMKVDCGTTVL